MNPFKLPIRSMQSKISPVRASDRPIVMQNCEIIKAGEAKRRPGFMRRFPIKGDGPVRVLAPFAGICGRFYRYVDGAGTIIFDDPAYEDPTTSLVVDEGSVWTPASEMPMTEGSDGSITVAPTAEPSDRSPSNLSGFTSSRGVTAVGLAWTYSKACNGVRILAKHGSYPVGPSDPDARIVYAGAGNVYSDAAAGYTDDEYYSAWQDHGDLGYSPSALNSMAGGYDIYDDFNRATINGGAYTYAYDAGVIISGGRVIIPCSSAGGASGGGNRLAISVPSVYPFILSADVSVDAPDGDDLSYICIYLGLPEAAGGASVWLCNIGIGPSGTKKFGASTYPDNSAQFSNCPTLNPASVTGTIQVSIPSAGFPAVVTVTFGGLSFQCTQQAGGAVLHSGSDRTIEVNFYAWKYENAGPKAYNAYLDNLAIISG